MSFTTPTISTPCEAISLFSSSRSGISSTQPLQVVAQTLTMVTLFAPNSSLLE